MTFAWYTPTLVQPLGQTKNSDINANLIAIQSAFNAQNAQTLTSAGYSIASTGQRNVVVDLSVLVNTGNYAQISLPQLPSVGDPPVTISLMSSGYSTDGISVNSAAVIRTLDGAKIMGISSGPDPLPFPMMVTAGDSMTLTFIGGAVGWDFTSYNVAPIINPAGTGMPVVSTPFSPFTRTEMLIDTTLSAININLDQAAVGNIRVVGQWCAITRRSGANNINVGSVALTFNGVAGPFVINTSNIRYLFTLSSASAFTVMTA